MSEGACDLWSVRSSGISKVKFCRHNGRSALPMSTIVAIKADLIPKQQKVHLARQSDVLNCPVAHLAALALHDNAFELPQLDSAERVFSLAPPTGAKKVILHWRDEMMNKPIVRVSSDGAEKELSVSLTLKRLESLSVKMGFRETLTWYCLRRLVLSAVDGGWPRFERQIRVPR